MMVVRGKEWLMAVARLGCHRRALFLSNFNTDTSFARRLLTTHSLTPVSNPHWLQNTEELLSMDTSGPRRHIILGYPRNRLSPVKATRQTR